MGKSGGKVEVTKYFMSQHFGICMGPLEGSYDALLKITVKEKPAWTGVVEQQQSFILDNGDLFGGRKKEGGVQGVVYWLPGLDDQVLDDVLATKLGRANGLDCPGYRGVATAFFVGPRGTPFASYSGWAGSTEGRAGFYWSANVPYLPGTWITVRRAPKGLLVGYSMIPRLGTNFYPYETGTTGSGSGFLGAQFSADFRQLAVADGNSVEFWDVASRTKYADVGVDINFDQGVAVLPSGEVYGIRGFVGPELISVTPAGVSIVTSTFEDDFAGGVRYVGGVVCVVPWSQFFHRVMWLAGGTVVGANVNFDTNDYFEDVEGNAWAVGCIDVEAPTANARFYKMTGGPESPVIATANTGKAYAMDNGRGQFVLYQASELFLIDKATWAIDLGPVSAAAVGDSRIPFRNVRPGANSIWLGTTEYSTEDLSVLRTITPANWVAQSVHSHLYDPLNHALWGASGGLSSTLVIRFLDRGDLDANPAHMIHESLTNTDWGMGSPDTALDIDSFEDAAITLFGESLGLSMIWLRQQSIQDFIQEVLDHAQAVLYVDPRTGLLTLKLIRGDYDPETLPVVSPSNADLSSFQRKLWGEIVNEVVATWTNPETEQDETVTVQDLASIATQGGIVSDGRNYYGVRTAELAQRLAQRDLRSAGAPVATCECEINRTLWEIRPASVVSLVWPEYGLDGVAMRITSVDYGRPGDPTIKLTLMEDVYGLDVGSYVEPPSTIWEDPSSAPAPMTIQRAFTLPLFMAAATSADTADAVYPEVLAGVLGTSDNDDTISYDLWSELADATGTPEWQDVRANTVMGHAELVGPLDAEAISTGIAILNEIGTTSPVVGGFVMIGDDGDEGNELALVQALATDNTLTLARGALDTVPRAWPAATPLWFIDEEALFVDPTTRAAGEVVSYKLLSRTSLGLLPLWMAPILSETLIERPWLPNRPAGVTAYGVAFSSEDDPIDAIARPDPWITVTWAVRNRLMEDGQVLEWTDGTVAPETGQTTKIEVVQIDGTTVITTHDGLTGTTFDVPDASFAGYDVAIIRTKSERVDDDGTFESLQWLDHWVQLDVTAASSLAAGVGTFSGASTSTVFASLGASGTGSTSLASSMIAEAVFTSSGAGNLPIFSDSIEEWDMQFGPLDNEAPSANYATLDTRNLHPVLDFDAGTDESAVFTGILPPYYSGGGISVEIFWSATSATSGNVVWNAAIERIDLSGLDIDADSFASAQTVTTAAPGTSGMVVKSTITFSNGAQMDSLAADEPFRLKVTRDADNGSDTMTGDAEIVRVMLVEQ